MFWHSARITTLSVLLMEQAIIRDGIGNHDIIDGLARIGDITAARALIRLSRSTDPEMANYALNRLRTALSPSSDAQVAQAVRERLGGIIDVA